MKKQRFLLLCLLAFVMTFAGMSTAQAGRKADMKVNYVLKNTGLKRDVQAKLRPLLVNYLADKKKANKQYDDLKDKLKPSINAGTVTDKQAQQLLDLKWQADEKELAVKREYEKKFKTVLSVKKTYLVFSLLNDSKSKMMGSNDDD
ncbi:MAG: hypothetical protein ILA39_05510 [Bacteroidaceae bacterium]|nr:hypothetical protein [Bacteroidaceae bacterium]